MNDEDDKNNADAEEVASTNNIKNKDNFRDNQASRDGMTKRVFDENTFEKTHHAMLKASSFPRRRYLITKIGLAIERSGPSIVFGLFDGTSGKSSFGPVEKTSECRDEWRGGRMATCHRFVRIGVFGTYRGIDLVSRVDDVDIEHCPS